MNRCFSTLAFLLLFVPAGAIAQTFSSGSTGADGALDLSTSVCSVANVWGGCEVQLPPNGVLNYTTVNIPSGKIVTFKSNLQNTPVILLAQGSVTIAGQIYLFSADVQTPGPGGFRGGPLGQPGLGPGGGQPTQAEKDGKWVGPLSLVPIVGGSGGGGYSYPGGGGGGAIVIASSTSISVSVGTGGGGVWAYGNAQGSPSGGYGSGGAIRLVANSLSVNGFLQASGSDDLHDGVIRLEAPAGALSFTGFSNPPPVLSTINPAIFASVTPSLSIVSVGGYPVPTYAGQRFDTVDLLLPLQLPDPINVVVAASNIPVGTQIGLNFGTTNAGTVTPGTLSGSTQSSAATVQVSGLNRAQLAYLFVSATFAVPQSAAALNPSGLDHVAQVQVKTAPGGAPQFAFFGADGSTIDSQRLPREFLKQFTR